MRRCPRCTAAWAAGRSSATRSSGPSRRPRSATASSASPALSPERAPVLAPQLGGPHRGTARQPCRRPGSAQPRGAGRTRGGPRGRRAAVPRGDRPELRRARAGPGAAADDGRQPFRGLARIRARRPGVLLRPRGPRRAPRGAPRRAPVPGGAGALGQRQVVARAGRPDPRIIEADPDDSFIEQIIRELTVQSLAEVATSTEVQRRFEPILQQHLETLEAVRRKAVAADGVVHFDLVDEGYEGFNKFIPYYLHPETTYSVALTRGSQRTKISVGSNPWAPVPRRHNIAKICERYGGGGHAVVGAISFKPGEVEQARAAVKEIVTELSSRQDLQD